MVESQYQIRQDSTSGTIIVNWTSTGTVKSVTRTGLSLTSGKKYFFAVKARNGVGLWSFLGYSNGILVDTSAPTAPGVPKEGSPTDLDYDPDGGYTVYWTASADAQSGISAYELQERAGASGAWMTISSTLTTTSRAVTGRSQAIRYFYQVRAKNGAGLWGAFSAVSDGILVDKTAPAGVVVTDDGATTTSASQLHAVWTAAADAEPGVAQYEYLIRRDGTAGTIIVNYTSVGLAQQVTKTGLVLTYGKTYYLGVRAKNAAGLYGPTTYSDGIQVVDTTAPTAPGTPTEGGITDLDVDPDGSYPIYWSAAADAQSGISAYELQERIGPLGAWTTLTSASASRSFTATNRQHGLTYGYQVRAKNGSGAWSPFSPASDGILVDKTAPPAPAVTDDGAFTAAVTQLHAVWSASDPESGIAQYQYLIRQDSTSGMLILNWTSVGTVTEVTRTGLSLSVGKTYFIGVQAKNRAGLFSTVSYSNGIQVVADTVSPTGTVLINGGATYTKTLTVPLTLFATDNSGLVSHMQFSSDGLTYTAPEPFATTKSWTLAAGDGEKAVHVKFKDSQGNWSAPGSDAITLDTNPPTLEVLTPAPDSNVTGAPQP